ncbi:MAG: hypothetical protein OXH52_07030 [Gammaproteobacteria bacterium]|nr:hypothetical protein [Gammaproteobacteria bacterium]
MLGPVLDVAVGLAFLYLLLSIACSSIHELLASATHLRAQQLRKAIEHLVGSTYTDHLYAHALITGLHSSPARPSYIDARVFAAALLDVISLHTAQANAGTLRMPKLLEAIAKVDSKLKVRGLLLSLADPTETNPTAFQERIAKWFDANMERVSGWYKRAATRNLLVIAVFLTLSTNADSLRVAGILWRDEALRALLSNAAAQLFASGQELADVQQRLEELPLGYPNGLCDVSPISLLGWAITILAISLGAPFWFDVMGRFANLRGAGPKDGTQSGS